MKPPVHRKSFFVSSIPLFIILIFSRPGISQVDTWLPIGPTVASTDTIFSIVINPESPDYIYAGSSGSIVYKSTDGGVTWTGISLGVSSLRIVDLIIHPNDTSVVIAATDTGGVFISSNGGLTWTPKGLAADTVLTGIIINIRQPDTLYAISSKGVFKSLNRGSTWTSRNDGLDTDSLNILSIANATINPNVLYIGTMTGKVYRTDNYGITWNSRGAIAGATNVQALVVDNKNPDIVYAGINDDLATDGVYKSTDGGINWVKIPDDPSFPGFMSTLSMKLDTSSTKKLYAGTNQNGVFQYLFRDSTWRAINTGLEAGHIHAMAIDPDSAFWIYAGTQGQGIYKFIGNRDPVITPIQDQQAVAGMLTSFTVTATDPDSGETNNLVFTVLNLPAGASYDSLATHVFSWIPTASDTGNHAVIFQVHDQRRGFAADTVIINVNRNPVITIADTVVTAPEDSTITFTVTASDPDSDSLFFSVDVLPQGATYIQTATNTYTFTWTPGYDQAGNYTINFTVNDGRLGSATQPVRFTILNTNLPPYFSPPLGDKSVFEAQTLAFIVSGTDPDGDPRRIRFHRFQALLLDSDV